jgi:hypothetical protein
MIKKSRRFRNRDIGHLQAENSDQLRPADPSWAYLFVFGLPPNAPYLPFGISNAWREFMGLARLDHGSATTKPGSARNGIRGQRIVPGSYDESLKIPYTGFTGPVGQAE